MPVLPRTPLLGTWVDRERPDSPPRIRLAGVIPCKSRCTANGSAIGHVAYVGRVMTANNFPSRTLGWLAIAIGGVTLIGVVALILFFTFLSEPSLVREEAKAR